MATSEIVMWEDKWYRLEHNTNMLAKNWTKITWLNILLIILASLQIFLYYVAKIIQLKYIRKQKDITTNIMYALQKSSNIFNTERYVRKITLSSAWRTWLYTGDVKYAPTICLFYLTHHSTKFWKISPRWVSSFSPDDVSKSQFVRIFVSKIPIPWSPSRRLQSCQKL